MQAAAKPPAPKGGALPAIAKTGAPRKRALPFPNMAKDKDDEEEEDDLSRTVDGLVHENKAMRKLVGDFLFAQLSEFQRFLAIMERMERKCEDQPADWPGRQAEASTAAARRDAERREREKRERERVERERERMEREREERQEEEEDDEIAESKTVKGKSKKL